MLDVNASGHHFTADTVEQLLRDVEQLLIDAASGDRALPLPLSELSAAHSGEWWRIAGCQVERAAVNELLGTGRAFVEGDDLVGYFADPGLTPRAAHLAALAGLRLRPTAITPTRYVICATAPHDLEDHAAWRSQPVLAEGDGRLAE